MNLLKTAIATALTGLLLTTAHAQTWLTNGLVAYYPFNGNANDASGYGNNGTVYGATLTVDRFGKTNLAYLLNGTSDYIKVLDAAANDLPAQFTISFWMNPRSGYGTPWDQYSWPEIISKWGSGGLGLASYNIGIRTTGQLYVGTHDGIHETTIATDTSVTTTNVWHQVTLVRDATSFRLYRDSQLLFSTNSLVQPQQNSTYNLNFGRQEAINSDFYGGGLDDIRIYNRALSSNEVAQLYLIESLEVLNIKKAVYLDSPNLKVGTNYQVQVSSNLLNWTNSGAIFTATNSIWRTTNYWDVENWNQLYFRLQKQ